MKKAFVLSVALLLLACEGLQVRNVEVNDALPTIIPLPAELTHQAAAFLLYGSDIIACDSVFAPEAKYLSEALEPLLGRKLKRAPYQVDAYLRLKHVPQLKGRSAYRLKVHENGIDLQAATPEGVFYGLQTLLQLQVAEHSRPGRIAFMHSEVTDEARFAHRGLLLDACRHFMDLDFVKRYVDLLARYKMNVLHWHLTEDQGWRFESKAYPKLTEVGAWRTEADGSVYGGFYTQDEMRELVAYAAKRHVTVMPEIELPGHSSAAIAAYPWLSCTGDSIEVETEWGVFKDIYCAGNDSTLAFLRTVMDEVVSIFPSAVIHIGGDEAPKVRWEACEKCQKRIREEGLHDEHELQSWFIAQMGEHLAGHGRRLAGWDEIADGGIPQGANWRVQAWRSMAAGKEAAEQGLEVVMSPTSHAYFDYDVKSIDLEKVYAFEPIPDGLDASKHHLIVGGECNMWTERAPQDRVDGKVFPRLLAMSEVLWSAPEKRDFEEFYQRVQREYPRLDSLGVRYGPEAEAFRVDATVLDAERLQMRILTRSERDEALIFHANEWTASSAPETELLLGKGRHRIRAVARKKASQTSYGDTLEVDAAVHHALGLIPVLESPYSEYYPGSGPGALTDGLIGGRDFRDGCWQAFSGVDLDAVLDWSGRPMPTALHMPFYTYNNAWIFMPDRVEVFASEDGERWELVGSAPNPLAPNDKRQDVVEMRIELSLSRVPRYLRVRAKNRGVCPPDHDAPGEPAWLFATEMVFE